MPTATTVMCKDGRYRRAPLHTLRSIAVRLGKPRGSELQRQMYYILTNESVPDSEPEYLKQTVPPLQKLFLQLLEQEVDKLDFGIKPSLPLLP